MPVSPVLHLGVIVQLSQSQSKITLKELKFTEEVTLRLLVNISNCNIK